MPFIVSNINHLVEWWNLEPFIGSVCLCVCVCLYSDCKITKGIKLRMLETPPSETALLIKGCCDTGMDMQYCVESYTEV